MSQEATPTAAGLGDERILLRPLTERDIPAYLGAFADDPEIVRLIGVDDDPTAGGIRDRIERPDPQRVELAIADRATDELLGCLWLHSFDARHRRLEVGFWLAQQHRRRGIIRSAVVLVVDWAFAEARIERLEITTTTDNAAVQALAEQLGFTREGLLRDRNLERGRRVSLWMFSLLPHEWRGGAAAGPQPPK